MCHLAQGSLSLSLSLSLYIYIYIYIYIYMYIYISIFDFACVEVNDKRLPCCDANVLLMCC